MSVLRRVLENSHGHMFYRHEYTKEQRMTEAQSQGSETCKMGSRKLHEIACSRLAYVYPHPPLCFSFVGGEGAATRRLVLGSQIVGKTRKYKAREKLLGREKGKRKGQRAFSPLLSLVYFRFSFVFAHAQFSGPSRSL